MRGRRGLVLVALVALLGAGCRLELDVNVEVASDGSGAVEVVVGLDPDALDKIGGDLMAVLDVGALEDAGWVLDGPAEEGDGFTRVRIRHPFATPGEAALVFEQLAGDGGPFQDFTITRDTSFAETRVRFTGRADFAAGLEALGDRGLAPEVDGEPLGTTVDEIEAQLGSSLSRLIQVRVRARLPGDVTSNAATKADNGAVWQIGFGEGGVDLEATGTQRRTSALVLAGLAVLVVVAFAGMLLFRLAGRVTATNQHQ
ncbi:MAG: hypothetical protein ACRDZU_06920 [Acidimicrobiales bacterium]